ncbi:Outer membrane lipoprotein-sorting protein [Alkalithermobacter thermoalcaliphilus JW-YL-7 = DSM 7308]|uniref:Lipoprotein n=1 Tax=Alkalithermobacter thermoalcaliphilus JW-YL-7 = DSM 7308 TaxID=1121328 RepID=A0A150FSD9_CLOPD|nr:lipoprotein [[Clostridium] paradoxum JW-YL-7 = DSM 7308]SHK72254.1 Outer membrane lipoprotein-sorting protein [[Clostridium] paradoxum JW-YL-7 = DSM 7308]
MKKWIFCFLMIILFITGCRESTDEELYYKLHKKISSINSYTCIADITVVGNRSPSSYTVIHSFKAPDYYKLEVLEPENLKGKVTVYQNDKVIVKNPNIPDEYKFIHTSKENKYLFIGDFIKNILENEQLKISSNSNFLILDTIIPSKSIYFHSSRLYVDKQTLKPHKMEILDYNGKVRFSVIYREFKYNVN